MTTKKNIRFYNAHFPALEDGLYEIEVNQNLAIKDTTITEQPQTKTVSFHVSGPKFNLNPSLIHSVYPPDGGKGDYRADLPSLVLTRSTLPWERSPNEDPTKDNSASWLFLLLLDQSETETQKGTKPLATEKNNVQLAGLNIPFTENLNAKDLKRLPSTLNYLTLDQSLISILPGTLKDLKYLSYARLKKGEEEHAVLLCNRLPQAGHQSTVYLVSLEGLYSGNGDAASLKWLDQKNTTFSLPYLYKWSFKAFDEQLYCITDQVVPKVLVSYSELTKEQLKPIVNHLADNTTDFNDKLKSIGIKDSKIQKKIGQLAKMPGNTFHQLIAHLSGGFGPLVLDNADPGLPSVGTLELIYHALGKDIPASAWYRGPLTAGSIDLSKVSDYTIFQADPETSEKKKFPLCIEDLIITNSNKDIIDFTYAAAFELGKLMALSDVAFATEFYKWKNEAATAIRMGENRDDNIIHLPLYKTPKDLPIPQNLKNKFKAWQNLEGIPYRYLIPNPVLLPNESIRYFYLDVNWVNAFTCGAFSIGHTVKADLDNHLQDLLLSTSSKKMGFLINSLAVSGWPGFEIDVYFDNEIESTTYTHLNKNDLDTNASLFLFDKPFSELRFHLHPAKLHSGFLYEDGQYLKSHKKNGIDKKIKADLINQVITPSVIATKLGSNSVAQYAAKMLEGTPAVVFKINEPK